MADTITNPADFMVAPLIGNILVMINKTCCIKDDVVMDGESFLTLAFEHLRPNGLYLFDEPEAALSPQRQLSLLMELCLETFIYPLTVCNNIC